MFKTLHLMVTTLCNRYCPYCCNKQMDLPPQVTKEDIKECDTLCITGGEPFLYANPCAIAEYFTKHYHFRDIYVYTNVYEFVEWYHNHSKDSELFEYIDGINLSVKDIRDVEYFAEALDIIKAYSHRLQSNRAYIMIGYEMHLFEEMIHDKNMYGSVALFKREWQKEFVPADDSIFRRI